MNKILDKLTLLKQCISYVVMENKWRDRSKYGMLAETAIMHKPEDISALHNLYLYPYSRVQSRLRLISYTGKLIIKSYAAIGADIIAITGNHTPTVGVPQYFLGQNHINDEESDIVVEEGAWVGARVTLLKGAKIGRGAVIGSCSLVNKEIPPYAVAVGSPAKVIATTFTIEQILEHEKKVFPESMRLSREFLTELFETQYKGLKSIGVDKIREADMTQYEQIEKKVNDFVDTLIY